MAALRNLPIYGKALGADSHLVQEFNYSEATAYRLLNAMKVVSEVPEIEEKIQSGKLSVSTLSQVQSYCQAQKRENGLEIKLEEKKQILEAVEGCSKRETEKVLAGLHPEQPLPLNQETERIITSHQTEIKFIATDELLAKLNRIKDLTAHQKINPSYAELFDLMAELVLNKIDPLRKAEKLKQKNQEIKEKEETLAKADILSPVTGKTHQITDEKSFFLSESKSFNLDSRLMASSSADKQVSSLSYL